MTRWEYNVQVAQANDTETLGQMGAEGWELVSVVVAQNSFGAPSHVRYYLKRPLAE